MLVAVFTAAVVDIASFLLEPVVVGEVMVVVFSVVNCEGDNGGDSNIGIGVGVVEVVMPDFERDFFFLLLLLMQEQQSSGERRRWKQLCYHSNFSLSSLFKVILHWEPDYMLRNSLKVKVNGIPGNALQFIDMIPLVSAIKLESSRCGCSTTLCLANVFVYVYVWL
ncbi:hypothetical protein C5167_048407 [Papaver somniferum]|uniref:Uncharacterized protein n=1 Tax=Papaver somniferum TaxID=3469 RepID=A0A4Y7KHW2_PAPSO|nr:hypothetical protein C5167_048407 [Papaver somniferum]